MNGKRIAGLGALWGGATAAVALGIAFAPVRTDWDLKVGAWISGLVFALPTGAMVGLLAVGLASLLSRLTVRLCRKCGILAAAIASLGALGVGVIAAVVLNFSTTYDARFIVTCTMALIGAIAVFWLYVRRA